MGKLRKPCGSSNGPFSVTETKELVTEVEWHKAIFNVALSADSLATILKALSRQNEVADDIRELKTTKIKMGYGGAYCPWKTASGSPGFLRKNRSSFKS
jgi:hypothetical protein